MKLEENGEKFVETVNVDLTGNSVEIKVPKHQDRMEVDILNDFSVVRYDLLVFLVSTSGYFRGIVNASFFLDMCLWMK